MAEKKIERTYNIPLRTEFLKVPKYKRTNKAVRAVRNFLIKHMKCEKIVLGQFINKELWKHGIKNPPHHLKVNVVKKDGKVYAELFGKKYEEAIKAEEVKEDAKGLDKVKDMLAGKEKEVTEEVKAEEEKKETKEEKPKATEKKEVKAEKKETKPEEKTEKPKPEVSEGNKEVAKTSEVKEEKKPSTEANKQ